MLDSEVMPAMTGRTKQLDARTEVVAGGSGRRIVAGRKGLGWKR
jgi:hypothetical protein